MNTEELLTDKLGINTDREKTGLYSDIVKPNVGPEQKPNHVPE